MNIDKDTGGKIKRFLVEYWLTVDKINLTGGQFSIKGHEYQGEWLECDHPYQVFKKGAQMGNTEIVGVCKTIHGLMFGKYPQGALYLLPTRDDVTDFSKGRFSPFIDKNPQVGAFVRDTDAVNIKQVGKSMLYLRGARSSHVIEGTKATASQLKTVPVDKIVIDEVDEMSPKMIQLALERVSHSKIQEIVEMSTPSAPDYGIDKSYCDSDQRIYIHRCPKCNHDNCLELEFPECLMEVNGGVIRICVKCKNELPINKGRWIARKPEVKDKVGWWISQLNSVYVTPKKILEIYLDPPDGDLSELYNSKLGMAYIRTENKLSKSDIYVCCKQDAMASRTTSFKTAMGVDVGKNQFHVVIGYPKTEKTYKVLYVGRVGSFNDVHDLAVKHNVTSLVVDAEPETWAVREFQKAESYRVMLCDYQERLKSSKKIDEMMGLVTVRRTETCDATHEIFASQRVELPRKCPEIEQFATEMANLAKVLQEDEFTGSKTFKYKKLGDEHYYHAFNYFMLACNNSYELVPETNLRAFPEREVEFQYDPFANILNRDWGRGQAIQYGN